MTRQWHDASQHLDDMPFWIPDEEGLGGQVGADLEDFQVEEIPAYRPNGKGDHLFCWIEKRGMGTAQAISALARALRVRRSDIGYAGLKDSWAVTRQYISIFGLAPSDLRHLDVPGITILDATRHHNKLKTGHLKGNRFVIRIQPERKDALAAARRIAAGIRKMGLPNIYGPQRFGTKDRNVTAGLRLLRGEQKVSDRRQARFLLSAVQSLLFNEYVRLRMERKSMDRILQGDVLRFGHKFRLAESEEWTHEAPDAVTGPIFGPRMVRPTRGSEPDEMERSALAALEVDARRFADQGRLSRGGRRDLLVFPEDLSVKRAEGQDLLISFMLPSGSYATVLLRELLRVPYARLRPFKDLPGKSEETSPRHRPSPRHDDS